MLIAFLPFFAQSVWWEFNETEFWPKFRDSGKTPIFAVCYTATCPKCQGIWDRFKQMALSLRINQDLILTSINCTAYQAPCRSLQVFGVPATYYITGTGSWEINGYSEAAEWRKYILTKVKPIVIDMSSLSAELITEKMEKTKKGRSVFQLSGNDEELTTTTHYMDKAAEMTNHTFFFKKEDAEPVLAARLSPECSVSTGVDQNQDVSEFIDSHRFSFYHEYNYEDWREMSEKHDLATLFVQGNIHSNDTALLSRMGHEFCGKLHFGWARIGFSFKILEKVIRGDQSEPFISVVMKNGCTHLFRDELNEISVSRFLQSVVKGTAKCNKGPHQAADVGRDEPAEAPQVPWHVVVGGIGVAVLAVCGFFLKKRWGGRKLE
jgi:hypothetical protein